MQQTRVTEEDVQEALKEASNWKAPGQDLIQNFWYKKLTLIHKTLTTCMNKLLQHPEVKLEFLTKGNTFLIPKDNNTSNPSKYRPITCLVTLYKLITAIITRKIYKHLHANNILTEEQKGCYKGSQRSNNHRHHNSETSHRKMEELKYDVYRLSQSI
jgi:hypothetical protein